MIRRFPQIMGWIRYLNSLAIVYRLSAILHRGFTPFFLCGLGSLRENLFLSIRIHRGVNAYAFRYNRPMVLEPYGIDVAFWIQASNPGDLTLAFFSANNCMK